MSVRFWFVIVLVSGIQACTSSADCESPQFLARSAVLEASVGARYADQYFTVLNTPISSCEAKSLRMIYMEFFFWGYRAPGSSVWGDESADLRAMRAGLRAGQEYRRAHPDLVAETYSSFGFAPISMEGVWTKGFEHSGFVPMEGYEGETWWAEAVPELAEKLPEGFVPDGGLRVRIKGHLSGRGNYGHLGAYERQVYVEAVNVLGPAQQAAAGDARNARA